MITFEQAKEIASNKIKEWRLAGNISDLVLLENEIVTLPSVYIFPYTSYRSLTDPDFLIGGNGPLFISKTDGRISTYRTGFSLEEMIDEYEEEYKIWQLMLIGNVLADKNKALVLKQLFHWSLKQVAEIAMNENPILLRGSKRKLMSLQLLLENKSVEVSLSHTIN